MRKLFLDDIRNPQDCATYMKYGLSHYAEGGWTVVRNYKEFREYLTNNVKHLCDIPEIISFDHDLAEQHYTPDKFWDDYYLSENYQENRYINSSSEEGTGYHCIKFLVSHILSLPDYNEVDIKNYLPQVLVHSMNPVGADNIRTYWNNFRKKGIYNPYPEIGFLNYIKPTRSYDIYEESEVKSLKEDKKDLLKYNKTLLEKIEERDKIIKELSQTKRIHTAITLFILFCCFILLMALK